MPEVRSAPAARHRLAFMHWLRDPRLVRPVGRTLGLLFGFSGIWLNHRAVLKLQLAVERQNSQLALPDPPPADARRDGGVAARRAEDRPRRPNNVRVENARPVPWAETRRQRPEGR